MFILLVNYRKSLEEVEKNLEAHRAFLEKYYALNKFVCSGKRNPRTGGCIICHSVTEIEVKEIIKEDPFFFKGIADYEIIEVIPTKCTEGSEKIFL